MVISAIFAEWKKNILLGNPCPTGILKSSLGRLRDNNIASPKLPIGNGHMQKRPQNHPGRASSSWYLSVPIMDFLIGIVGSALTISFLLQRTQR